MVTTPPPDRLNAGEAFTLAISAEDPFGNVSTAFTGDVTISVPNDPGFTTTVHAKDGVATFAGLTLNESARGESIEAVASGLSDAVTPPLNAPSIVLPSPTIIGEQIVILRKKNKRGKPIGKPFMVGFAFEYSTSMDPASAGLAANYQIDTVTKGHVKNNTSFVLKPVAFTSAYGSSTNTVMLTIKGKPNFAKGGRITVDASSPGGVTSAVGVPLNSSDTYFTILANATGIAASG